MVLPVLGEAVICPLLKEPPVHTMELDNFHPDPNFSFQGKLLRKVDSVKTPENPGKRGLFGPFPIRF